MGPDSSRGHAAPNLSAECIADGSSYLGAHEYTDESYCSTNMGPDSARCHAAPHCGTEQVAHGLPDLGPDAGTVLCSDQ